jgi:WD40 repeat protein/3',5'-cyclic AMP phosphodiesterase CpdA
MAARESITVLHLSDPQFGKNHRFGSEDGFDTLWQRLKDDLTVLQRDKHFKPDMIVLSGDLAEWGRSSEFRDCMAFLIKVSEFLQLPRRQVVIVPGNHDLNRDLSKAYFAECAGEERKPEEPYWPKWRHYKNAFDDFYREEKDISFTLEEPWSYWEIPELKVAVAALNSTMKESHEENSHYGWAGEQQFSVLAKRLEAAKEKGWFRLGVIHHNVQRGAIDDEENLRDAEDLDRVLAPSLNLLLHGHTHNSKLGWLRPAIPVLATGSAALKQEARPKEVPNQYQIIRISSNGIERWTRRYEGKRWIGDTSSSEDGGDWRTEDKVEFAGVHGTFPKIAPSTPRDGRLRTNKLRANKTEISPQKLMSPRDDLASRVSEVLRLRLPGAKVELISLSDPVLEYLRVQVLDGPFARVYPVGVCDNISAAQIEAFSQRVFARYRALDATLPCELVYGGDAATPELIRQAGLDNILLSSFLEYQGIVDFRGYLGRQTKRLESDVIYPPSLYVPQHFEYEVGRDRHQSRDACATVLDWLREPLPRFILILGDFGAGKTFLLHEVARRIPSEIPHISPMLIELRSLEKAGSVDQLIAQHLAAAGEQYINLAAFPYMLREGRIALLFDGFDELAQRVTYERAADHFETLIKAAGDRAKIVVTSRTQHFESDRQVKTVLYERTAVVLGLYLARVQQFDEDQIREFLIGRLGGVQPANRRFALIRDIRDLLGLSHNPRMLTFIADLPEQQLLEAKDRSGHISAAELYRMIIERWLTFEYQRVQPRGAAPTLSVEERWDAVTALALRLWVKLEGTIQASELSDEVGSALNKLAEKRLAPEVAAHLVGSGTLLVRDEGGAFAFVHQSVMEWLVANHAAKQTAEGIAVDVLAKKEMSPLMADFFCDLAGHPAAVQFAKAEAATEVPSGPFAKANANLILTRLGQTAIRRMAGQNLRGQNFSGAALVGADFRGSDLSEASFNGANLTRADFTDAVMERADFTGANMSWVKLNSVQGAGARLLGANLSGATFAGADLRRAKLVGANVSADALALGDTFGAALPSDVGLSAEVSGTWSASRCIAWSAHGVIALGHKSGMVHLCDASSGQQLRSVPCHEGRVMSVAFSGDGRLLASAGADGTVRLSEVGSGRELRRLHGHTDRVRSIAFSPDSLTLASASEDETVRLWDVGSGQQLRILRGHDGAVGSVAFSPDGKLVASGGDDETLRLWEVLSGLEFRRSNAHAAVIRSVAFSPDGKLLASGGDDKTVRLWEADSLRELFTLRGYAKAGRTVAFSPDSKLLASGAAAIVCLWETASGRELRSFGSDEDSVLSIAFSPDGKLLASGGDETVRLWETASGLELRRLGGTKGYVWSVAFDPTGKLLASAGPGNPISIWEAGSGRELHRLDNSNGGSVAFSPSGNVLASGSDDGAVQIWHAASGEQLRSVRGHQGYVASVAFSPDGKLLASGGADSSVWLWDAASGRELRKLRGHTFAVWSIVFSPHGTLLASASADKTLRLWDAASGQELRSLRGHADYVRSVAFSPDGKLLASGSADRTLRLWDAGSGQELNSLRGHTDEVLSVAFSPDGEVLASSGADSTVRLWDRASGLELRSLQAHAGDVMSVAFSPDGKLLASASNDNTVRLWQTDSGKLLLTRIFAAEGWAAFTPDNRYKVSGNLGGAFWFAINLCRFEPGELDSFLPSECLRQLAVEEPFW